MNTVICVRPQLTAAATPLQPVGRAPYAQRASIQDVRVDHRGVDVGMAEQFLNRPDVVPALEQVGRERMAERMATDAFATGRTAQHRFSAQPDRRAEGASWKYSLVRIGGPRRDQPVQDRL